ncbi:ribose-5-phosphate isomerase RpiA [Sodalis-like secondary symbiont of Drepanosiphum platanoidis]|uniref:ribose-5-phosphate isomerase RpiA n=1 Tax=Sodalis-like secondary symbiont of Drepanosiphum platanoidis TaxID=2994493 RepID=UPI0034639DD8
MNQNFLKKKVAIEALKYIKQDYIVGIGTGTTVNYFINELKKIIHKIKYFVSSSYESSKKLKKYNIPILSLDDAGYVDIYIDSADEINNDMQMIKGGGGALTKEKIIAELSKIFICIIDESKKVNTLGNFPLPIEIIPMSKLLVYKKLLKIGGNPIHRKELITENGNIILDIHNLSITDPVYIEKKINNIPGVVTVGLFSQRKADIVLIGKNKSINTIKNIN